MPQYLLSVCHSDDYSDVDFNSPDMQRIGPKVMAFNEELQSAGQWVFGAGLRPASTATVVRSVDGQVSMTDGPFAETKEQMGGFWIVNVDDLDTALDLARRGSEACELPIEVRPMEDA
jgi:hypothetical protein